MQVPSDFPKTRRHGAVLAAIAYLPGLAIFALAAPPLQPWNLVVTVVIGTVGVSALVWISSRPRTSAVITIVASALTPIATPAAWCALFLIGARERIRTAVIFLLIGLLGSAGLFGLYVLRWSTSDTFPLALLICIFSLGVMIVSTIAGIAIGVQRRNVAKAQLSLLATMSREAAVVDLSLAGERERMTRDIHDHIGHRLAILNLYSANLRNANELADDELSQVAEVMQQQIQAASAALTDTLRATSPTQQMSSSDALEAMFDEIRAAGVRIDLRIDGALEELPPHLSRLLVNFCREGLTNALKHTVERSIAVTIGTDHPGAVSARITTGRPRVVPETSDETTSRGLVSLQREADDAGGVVTLTTSADSTVLELAVAG